MGWRGYGEPLLTADATAKRVYSTIVPTKNILLRAMGFGLIWVNDPAVTSFNGKLFADNGSTAPGALIATSTDSRTKADITAVITLGNGRLTTFVKFNDVPLRQNTKYHFVINLVGYTGTASSNITWEKSWPDPIIPFSGHSYKDLLRDTFYIYPQYAKL